MGHKKVPVFRNTLPCNGNCVSCSFPFHFTIFRVFIAVSAF